MVLSGYRSCLVGIDYAILLLLSLQCLRAAYHALDRPQLNTSFFDSTAVGILYYFNIFFGFSDTPKYILILPGFGMSL